MSSTPSLNGILASHNSAVLNLHFQAIISKHILCLLLHVNLFVQRQSEIGCAVIALVCLERCGIILCPQA